METAAVGLIMFQNICQKERLDMSRIHDALRQMETSAETDISPSPLPNVRDVVEMSTAPSLLASVAEKAWECDPTALLSFEGDLTQKAAEEFRALRFRLQQIREKLTLQSVLVTSALPNEGKSYVALNLARALALQPEFRVLVIDGDLRGRRLHQMFGAPTSPGLAEYLLCEADEASVLQRGKAENLFLISAGRKVAGTAELIANGRFRGLISHLTTLFDWIIVDSHAAISVSDTCLLANCCDGLLMVVRSRETPVGDVRKALERFPESSYLGVVLNEINNATNKRSKPSRM